MDDNLKKQFLKSIKSSLLFAKALEQWMDIH